MKRKFKINNKIIDAETIIEAVKEYKGMAPKNMTIEALRKDEEAAIDAYKVAIENLQGVVSNKAIEVLQGIMKDEIDHLEKLDAILYGREENVEVDEHEEITEDSCKTKDGRWTGRKGKSQYNYDVIDVYEGNSGRLYALIKRAHDYAVGAGYNPSRGDWDQGYYDFTSEQEARRYAEKHAREMNDSVKDDDYSYEVIKEQINNKNFSKELLLKKAYNGLTRGSMTKEEYNKLVQEIKSTEDSCKDERLSPMTYKKLREMGYNEDRWKNLTQEEANRIVAGSKKEENNSNKKEINSNNNLNNIENELKKLNINAVKQDNNNLGETKEKDGFYITSPFEKQLRNWSEKLENAGYNIYNSEYARGQGGIIYVKYKNQK